MEGPLRKYKREGSFVIRRVTDSLIGTILLVPICVMLGIIAISEVGNKPSSRGGRLYRLRQFIERAKARFKTAEEHRRMIWE